MIFGFDLHINRVNLIVAWRFQPLPHFLVVLLIRSNIYWDVVIKFRGKCLFIVIDLNAGSDVSDVIKSGPYPLDARRWGGDSLVKWPPGGTL